ncbi:MAG: hypothetical protein JW934_06855 [Anaerolineae bacterium]|nr:hypothetical protein [Anaerolineae bacterium]
MSENNRHSETESVAQRLAQINRLMPAVPAALRHRIDEIVLFGPQPHPVALYPTVISRLRPALWGALVTALTLVLLWTITPAGRGAWARVLISLKLRQTTIEITPAAGAEPTRAVREPLRDLLAVELTMGRAPSLPKSLPESYALREMAAVSFPDLPAWISQPFYVELCYGTDQAPKAICLREYRLLFREEGGILSYRQLGDSTIEPVGVAGVDGVLVTTYGDVPSHSIVWERDGLLLELHSEILDKETLLEIAQTVR